MSAILKLRDILHDPPSRETFWQVCEAVDATPSPEVVDYASAHLGEWPAEALRGRGLESVGGETDPQVEQLRVEAMRWRAAVRRLEGAVEGRVPFWEDPYWQALVFRGEVRDVGYLRDRACDCAKEACDASCAETAWWCVFSLFHGQLEQRAAHAHREWLWAKHYAAREVSHAARLAREEEARLQAEAARVAARVAAAKRKAQRDARKARLAAKQAQSA